MSPIPKEKSLSYRRSYSRTGPQSEALSLSKRRAASWLARPRALKPRRGRFQCLRGKSMTAEPEIRRTLSESGARQLANATKTRPQWSGITPRWLVSFLPWVPVEAGIYRLNRVKEDSALTDADVQCSPARDRDADLPETFVDYED